MMYTIRVSDGVDKVIAKWKKSNPNLFKKYKKIYKELLEHPKTGLGHPEALRFKREFPCLQAGDDSVSFRLSFGLQYIFLLFLPIYDQRTLQNRILSRGMVNDYATMEIRSAGRRMNIPSTD